MKTKTKPQEVDWKDRAEKAERVVMAAAEFEYRYFKCLDTYTSREAAIYAERLKDTAFEELRWALRYTGTIKRD